jgi:hypothetical protein
MKESFFYIKDEKLAVGDEALFKEFTGAQLISTMTAPPTPLNPSLGELHVSNWIKPLYEKGKPYKLVLKVGKTKQDHSLIAGEDIPKGVVVTEYLGDFLPPQNHTSSYKFGPIDGLFKRNLAAQIDDGFPNLAPFYLYTTKIPLRIVFLSLEEIKKGDLLNFSYGLNHSVKTSPREEFRLKEMFSFFKTHSLSSLREFLKPLSETPVQNLREEVYFDYEGYLNKLQYPFHTPKALSLLLSEGVLKKEDVKLFFERLDNRLYLLNFPLSLNQKQQKVYDEIHSLLL